MLAIVVSRADEASVHIGERLLELADWTETVDETRPEGDGGGTVYRTDGITLREFDALHLELDEVASAFNEPTLLVFASRHAGETDELLTAHHTGNVGVAEYGGDAGQFARAAPNAQRVVLDALTDYAPDGYDVSMECTHHGPTEVGVPSMFVEVGSDEPQWRDPEAAHAVARAILDLRGVTPDATRESGRRRQLVGFGGGHYTPRFERVVRETDWAVGHVAADWSLAALDEWADADSERTAVINRLFAASGADYALVDGDRPSVVETVETLGYRVVDERFVRVTTDVSLSLVKTLEAAINPVAEGLRFGEPATDDAVEWHVVDVPETLLADATGLDSDAVRSWMDTNAVAFDTEQSGTIVTGPLVLPSSTPRSSLVSALADILRKRYHSVERDGEELLAREQRFDPTLAHEAGVPEGPKYGRLSSGQSVEVDGREIQPESVHSERLKRYPL